VKLVPFLMLATLLVACQPSAPVVSNTPIWANNFEADQLSLRKAEGATLPFDGEDYIALLEYGQMRCNFLDSASSSALPVPAFYRECNHYGDPAYVHYRIVSALKPDPTGLSDIKPLIDVTVNITHRYVQPLDISQALPLLRNLYEPLLTKQEVSQAINWLSREFDPADKQIQSLPLRDDLALYAFVSQLGDHKLIVQLSTEAFAQMQEESATGRGLPEKAENTPANPHIP
jgi:hypothetical protein